MVPYWYTETSPINALAKSYTGFALKTEKKCHWIAPSYMLLIFIKTTCKSYSMELYTLLERKHYLRTSWHSYRLF